MADSVRKERIFLSPPHMGGEEKNFVADAFASNYIAPLGPMVDAFEKEFSEYTGIPHCVAVSSGTAALHLALVVMEIGAGDEVFASTLTFIGGVTPIVFCGARPVFIDADPATWNMSPDLLAEELDRCSRSGSLPKAVIPTDLYGQSADLERIVAVCEPYGIPVIVDSAESLGTLYKGTQARPGSKAAIFSFNGNKIITTSGGGMLASRDCAFIEYARKLSQQAREPLAYYEHIELGFNYRMSNIVAAIGRGQLRVLDERVQKKREIYEYYKKGLQDAEGIDFMPEAPYGTPNQWLTVILVDPKKFGADNETIRMALETENIESRPVWNPMHCQPVFSNGHRASRAVGGQVAEELFRKGLCLPSGTAMTYKEMDRVVSIVLSCRK